MNYVIDEVDTPHIPKEEQGVDEKRESLCVLAVLEDTQKCLGENLSLGNIKKLTTKNVEKYYARYQAVRSREVSTTLLESGVMMASKLISYVLPIDDVDALCKDLVGDGLVKTEIANLSGSLVLRGGRFVPLASALTQIGKHIKFEVGAIMGCSEAVKNEIDKEA